MSDYKIKGKNKDENITGDKNFLQTGRAILLENGIPQSVLFGIKTPEQMIENLKELGFEVFYITESTSSETEEQQFNEYKGMEISKIKIKKDEKFVEILYYKNGNHSSKEVKFNGYEEALDDFLINFRALSKDIIEVLDFPEEWLNRLTTTGISISWKEGMLMGMVITSQMEIMGLNCPLNLNTPFIRFYSYAMNEDSNEDVHFSKDCEELIEKIMSNAKAYMLGDTKTKQQKLFEG